MCSNFFGKGGGGWLHSLGRHFVAGFSLGNCFGPLELAIIILKVFRLHIDRGRTVVPAHFPHTIPSSCEEPNYEHFSRSKSILT